MSTVQVPPAEAPLVSVVILTYGGGPWLAECLESLVANTPPVYELIVLDNASPDGTADWLAATVRGAILVRNPANVGFGPGVNQAVLLARGRYLCLLNSDAIVEPGWLGHLVADLEQVPGCGAVVPRFLNLDGTLQEAGAVVGRHGSTMSIGYGDDPQRPWYRFPRVVPYGSASCMLVRRSSFLDLGGFDPRYGMGYYEDVDLCFRMAEAGRAGADGADGDGTGAGGRVVYEPRAVVRHVRGASTGAGQVVKLREINAERFRQRWAHRLHRLPSLADLPTHPYRVTAARDAGASGRVLLVGARLPGRGRAGEAGDRLAALASGILGVAGEVRVTLVGLDDPGPAEELRFLLDAGVEVIWGVTDWDDWMTRHLCHYTAAIVVDGNEPGGAAGRAATLLGRYQPQAAVVIAPVGHPPRSGILPAALRDRAAAVWCRGPADAGEAAQLAPEAPAAVVGDDGAGLAPALAELGIVPSGPAGWPQGPARLEPERGEAGA